MENWILKIILNLHMAVCSRTRLNYLAETQKLEQQESQLDG